MRASTWRGLLALALACCLPACRDKNASVAAGQGAGQLGTSGALVDFDGDGELDLVAGAPFANAGPTVGVAAVHRGSATGFSEQPAWTLTGGDNFGTSVQAVGDLDGDGTGDLAVSAANGDGPLASMAGTVTIYRGGTSGQVLATLSGEQALDKFGASITGGCDLNADGRADLVVGATSHSPGPDRYLGGAYYLYFGPRFSDDARLKIPATLHAGILGFSSACGDVNGDGVDDLVLSSIWTHGVIWHAAKILVFYGKPGLAPDADAPDLLIEAAPAAPTPAPSHFGDALAVLDDLDGDGLREIAIGVPSFYAIPAPTSASPMFDGLKGRVFIVKGGAGQRTVNVSARPAPADLLTTVYGVDYLERFGTTIAPVGDLDADGKPDFAVGAPHAHAAGATSLDSGWVSGRVYVFLGKDVKTDGTATQAAVATALSRPGRTLHYGAFLAPFTRGGPRMAVGAPTANRQAGAVFVEDLTTAVP